MAEYVEDVYESNGLNDDKCSLVDEGYWYENDLLLAAELGKTLLERNKDLETQLNLQTKNTNNLRMEIDLLKKQLETLRELNRNKMILYEDVDRNSHDLEITNRNLALENKKVKDRIHHLSKKNLYLEQQVEDYLERLSSSEQEIEDLKKLLNAQAPRDFEDSNYNIQNFEEQSTAAESTKQRMCSVCKELKSKIFQLEADMEFKNQEYEDLKQRNSDLQKKLKLTIIELEDIKNIPQINFKNHGKTDPLMEDLYSSLEYDIDHVDEKPVEVGSLDTGGKVFTSKKSMESIGAETAKFNEPSSLLNELDEKYSNLVNQYETLLQSTQTLSERSCDRCETISTVDESFQKKLDNIFSEETRRQRKLLTTQNYRPKYKELFRDAFSILKDMKQNKRHDEIKSKSGFMVMKTLSDDHVST